MLSMVLGPGLLGQVYDGLQNPLEHIAGHHGTFLPRGVAMDPLDKRKKWSFVPRVQIGVRLSAGGILGTVQEGKFAHKVMVPFEQRG
jgi:V/A-type H+-transporting ATPase subunit A